MFISTVTFSKNADRMESDRKESVRIESRQNRVYQNGVCQNGVRQNRVRQNGVCQNGVPQNRVWQNRVRQNRVRQNANNNYVQQRNRQAFELLLKSVNSVEKKGKPKQFCLNDICYGPWNINLFWRSVTASAPDFQYQRSIYCVVLEPSLVQTSSNFFNVRLLFGKMWFWSVLLFVLFTVVQPVWGQAAHIPG